jgi:hypothetical protein
MKFEGLGLTIKLFGFWGLCLWFRSMLGVSHLFMQTTNFSYQIFFKNHPNSIFKSSNFKRILGFGVYVYGLG